MNPTRWRRALTRRALMQMLGLAAGGAMLRPWRSAHAGQMKHLAESDPAAIAQGYVADSARVEPKKYPQFIRGQSCANCLQLQGKPGESYRPCAVFPGNLVAAAGWCKSWTPEM